MMRLARPTNDGTIITRLNNTRHLWNKTDRVAAARRDAEYRQLIDLQFAYAW